MLITLCACSSNPDGAASGPIGPQADATVQPTSTDIGSGSTSSEFTPELGIQIDHASAETIDATDSAYIEAQWLHMQNCLQLSAMEPSIVVVDDKISPIDSTDDVLRHIDGQIQASAHVTDSSTSIQIRSADFDGSLGEPGGYLRSILGRYLWLSAGLPERDYNYDCANTAP